MTRLQRTNTGVATQVARWLRRRPAAQLVPDGPDERMRYLLARVDDGARDEVARFRTVREFARAIETPGGVPWT